MSVATEIYHLQQLPRYGSEKPYTMRYVPDGGVAVTNVEREKHVVSVKDMRRDVDCDAFNLDRNGFTVSKMATEMKYEDYDDHEKITNVYLPAIESKLLAYFPGSTVDFVSYLVSRHEPAARSETFSHKVKIRKREQSFPYSTGERYSFAQPNIVAHVDATSDDLIRQICRRHGDDADRLLRGRCQYITVWKPLKGPLHDYPLALCDFQSLDPERDLEPQDIVDRDEVLENVHVYHRPQHQWYYLSGQQDSEALVFRQADTQAKKFGELLEVMRSS